MFRLTLLGKFARDLFRFNWEFGLCLMCVRLKSWFILSLSLIGSYVCVWFEFRLNVRLWWVRIWW